MGLIDDFFNFAERTADAAESFSSRTADSAEGFADSLADIADLTDDDSFREAYRKEFGRNPPARPDRDKAVQALRRLLSDKDNMAVNYDQWISIAFSVAKQQGADFSTTQSEIESGSAPTAEAIRVFADIWQDRKEEIQQSRSAARRVATEEIEV